MGKGVFDSVFVVVLGIGDDVIARSFDASYNEVSA